MTKASLKSLLALLVTLAVPAAAQAQRERDVPASHRPPAGMCRIWIDGVPAGQQPAPTDCQTALRTRPSNGRVIFGEERETKGKGFLPKDWQGRRDEPRRDEPRREEPRREEPRREATPRREEPKREEPKREETKREPRRGWAPRKPPQQDPR